LTKPLSFEGIFAAKSQKSLPWALKTCVAVNKEYTINLGYPEPGSYQRDSTMNKPMTKTQLIAALAEAMGSDKKTATAALDAISAVVSREVAAGGAITLPGLGKMACRARPQRQVRNPATGESVTKAADKQVKFTIAKALKDSVNA
jgi:DNA-binding protein HU-beta